MKARPERKDFTAKDLPKNRFLLFWDLVIHQWRSLFVVSLLMTLFALPFFAVFYLFQNLISAAEAQGVDAAGIYALSFYWALALIPGVAILHIGIACAFEVGKGFSFQEGVLPGQLFFLALREKWWKALILGLISGVLFFASMVGALSFLMVASAKPILAGIGIGALVLLYLTIECAFFFTLTQMTIYENTLLASLRNGFIFSFVRLPLNFLFFLLFPGSYFILLFVHPIASYVALGVYALFSGFGILIWNIYSNGLFDKFINREYYPELVGKGMAPRE
ncbi:MAG: hypothetical protein J6038_00400 [Bacilli bacterium]|nr:hypothetical protein [Bacilli bacterium]